MKTSSQLVARSLMTAVVAATVAMGCGGSHKDDGDVNVAREALTATDVFGFEDPSAWSTTTAGVGLTKSTTHSQGSFSLQVTPSRTNGFTPLASTKLSTLAGVSPTLAWDVMLPTQQPNPNWFGAAQMYLSCPSRNINSAFLGQVELTGKPLNVWNTITFPVSNAQITSLLQAGYTDLTITVVINVPVPTTGVYKIDNLRFVPLAANACGGRPNGTSCTDGNPCTVADTCQAGACRAGAPLVCQPSDQCHSAGVCNTTTGLCSNPAKANGTACDDGNKCTQTDTCQTGVCAGANPLTCVASDACHVAGSCVPATGACTNPPAADGKTCDDQNACTATSACKAGACVGAVTTVCPALDQCHVGACDPASGSCGFANAADGTACDDADACTSGDTCQSGVCGGARDSLCGVEARFEEAVDLGNGVRIAIFSYTNPGQTTVSAPYGARNFVSVDGNMVATPAKTITSFAPGDHPGAFAYPLPAGAMNMSWTLGPHTAKMNAPAQPLGADNTVTLHDAAFNPITTVFDTANADVAPTVVLSASPAAFNVAQGGFAATTLNVERVGGFSDPLEFGIAGQQGLIFSPLPLGTAPITSYSLAVTALDNAPLGPQQVLVTASSVDAQPTVTLTVNVVPPPVSTVTLANLSMVAPLTMQSVKDTFNAFVDIDAERAGDGVIEPFANWTTTPIPPFITDPNAPRWAKGSGFAVADALGPPADPSSVTKVIVASPQVNFQVGVSLTDDTSALAITAHASGLDDFRDQINNGTGITSCTSSLFPSVVEGNHGRYTVRIEQWQDGATNCPAPEHLDPDYPNDGVTFDASPDGQAGCWVQAGSATTDLYSSQPLPDIKNAGINGPNAVKDQTVDGVMTIPVTLPTIATFLRYVVKLEEADTRVPNDTDVIGWSNNRLYPDAFSCEEKFNFTPGVTAFTPLTTPTTGQGYSCTIGFDPNNLLWDAYVPFCPPAVPVLALPGENANEGTVSIWRFRRPVVNGQPQQQTFVYEQAFNPFEVVVEPVAVAQMKVLPYTILYQPPGNQSTATYTMTTSYGTTITAQSALESDQSTTIENKNISGSSFGDDFAKNFMAIVGLSASDDPGSTITKADATKVSDFLKNTGLSIAFNVSSSTTWDDTTKVGSGTTTTAATTTTSNFQAVTGFMLQKLPSLVPGATGTYEGAPFWGDRILLLVHPQVGIWQANNQNAIILLGAQGNGPTFEPTVSQLDACARQAAPYQNGLLIDTSSHKPRDASDVLTSDECLQLLQLDPFWNVGQSLPGAPNARILTPPNHPPAMDYGFPPQTDPMHPGSELAFIVSDTLTHTAVTTNTNVATYSTTVTEVVTSSDTETSTLSFVGLSAGLNNMGNDSTGNSSNWTLTYQQSFAATAQSSILFGATLDDNHNMLPTNPTAFLFQDAVFGAFMFQDPNAPLAP